MTKFLDLDAIHEDLKDVSIKLDGIAHRLVPLSVFDFIANQKTIARMSQSGDALEDAQSQMEGSIEMALRSFPTASADALRKLTHVQLGRLMTFIREVGKDVPAPAQEAASVGSENPPQA